MNAPATDRTTPDYDYVIVGAGTAGCTLAARLSEDPDVTVLLLEAGGEGGGLWEALPLGVGKVLHVADRVWHDMTEPVPGSGERPVDWAAGRGLGGSSAVNAMLFVRGHPAMYDRMAAAGCTGWDHAACLPFFRMLEDCRFSTSPRRGSGGPIGVERVEPDPISEAFLDACETAGHRRIDDYNDEPPEGASYLQLSTRHRLRCSAAAGYLRPVRQRPNLTVRTNAPVQRIVFQGRTATGVALAPDGSEVRARREVIVAAGAVRSPALLERSGIGAMRRLEALGIDVVADRREVGENLQDHLMPRICYATSERGTVNHFLNSPLAQVREGLKFVLARKGMLAKPPLTATLFCRSDAMQPLPNLRLQVGLLGAKDRIPAGDPKGRTPAARAGLDPESSIHIGVYDLYPRSRGSVHLRAADPAERLAVRPAYLSDEADRRAIVAGLRHVMALAASAPLKRIITSEIRPAFHAATDDDILGYARATGHTCWHPTGTCRMGDDADAVVDPHCRVNGVERLRVVDASVFPFLTSSNTNVPVFMLAERVARMIRDAQGGGGGGATRAG
ncbi:MAG TPA: GMC family oxidoreductase N-terminal domain-containing protein [Casimicrobiaceae bacterium]|nr:GMC family oxidoreductase N-terminal domain-containing protein [Casimicrobiaceae bacterium]